MLVRSQVKRDLVARLVYEIFYLIFGIIFFLTSKKRDKMHADGIYNYRSYIYIFNFHSHSEIRKSISYRSKIFRVQWSLLLHKHNYSKVKTKSHHKINAGFTVMQ